MVACRSTVFFTVNGLPHLGVPNVVMATCLLSLQMFEMMLFCV